jgi:hypothetical protein
MLQFNIAFAVGGLIIGLVLVVIALAGYTEASKSLVTQMPTRKSSAIIGGVLLVISILVRMGFVLSDRHRDSQSVLVSVAPAVASSPAEFPRTNLPRAEWKKLVVAARERSEFVRRPDGMHIVMSGDQFQHHQVYTNGDDCPYRAGQPCPLGSTGSYAMNLSSETNIVSYAYEAD